MTTKLLTGEARIWPKITAAVRKASRADVAVAYFGKGGARRLPLKRGSRLVVDASEYRVKTGATHPNDLLTLRRKGVAIYSYPNLHAKVVAFPKRAFIGSANNSENSAKHLSEAVIESTDPGVVVDAKQFVDSLCIDSPLGPTELEQLQLLYRDPKVPKRADTKVPPTRKPVWWWESYSYDSWPDGFEDEAEERQAKAKRGREFDDQTHEVTDLFTTVEPKWKKRDTIVFVEKNHPKRWILPPGRVLDIQKWSNGRKTYWFTYTEQQTRNRWAFDQMLRGRGRGRKQRLGKYGRLNRDTAAELSRWWNERGT